MPNCVLHVEGVDFEPELYLSQSDLVAFRVWRKGDAKGRSKKRSKQFYDCSGFSVVVSEADGDLDQQIQDAICFMQKHDRDLKELAKMGSVEDQVMDFGYDCRLNSKVLMQGEYLPVTFLKLVAKFEINVALSMYPPLVSN